MRSHRLTLALLVSAPLLAAAEAAPRADLACKTEGRWVCTTATCKASRAPGAARTPQLPPGIADGLTLDIATRGRSISTLPDGRIVEAVTTGRKTVLTLTTCQPRA